MKKLSLIALAMLAGLISSPAWAKPPLPARTYVSPTGSDTMPYPGTPGCQTIGNPCQTFNYALSQTLPGGEVIAVASGSYAPVTITNSVTIEAAPGVYAGITPVGTGAGVTVNGTSGATVVLRGLTIQGGTGDGIDFNSGAALSVENCVINGVGDSGISHTSSGNLFVNDTVIRNCDNDGVNLNNSGAHESLSHVRLVGNSYGLSGLNGAASISDSVISGNIADGIVAGVGGGTPRINVESCQISNNGTNGIEVDAGTIWLSNSTVTLNSGTGLYSNGVSASIFSRVNNTVVGNNPDESGGIGTFPVR